MVFDVPGLGCKQEKHAVPSRSLLKGVTSPMSIHTLLFMPTAQLHMQIPERECVDRSNSEMGRARRSCGGEWQGDGGTLDIQCSFTLSCCCLEGDERTERVAHQFHGGVRTLNGGKGSRC